MNLVIIIQYYTFYYELAIIKNNIVIQSWNYLSNIITWVIYAYIYIYIYI